MTQHTIDIPGLPEGYEVLDIKLDEEINHTWPGSVASVKATLYVQKNPTTRSSDYDNKR